jgi:hypothetical protein
MNHQWMSERMRKKKEEEEEEIEEGGIRDVWVRDV